MMTEKLLLQNCIWSSYNSNISSQNEKDKINRRIKINHNNMKNKHK